MHRIRLVSEQQDLPFGNNCVGSIKKLPPTGSWLRLKGIEGVYYIIDKWGVANSYGDHPEDKSEDTWEVKRVGILEESFVAHYWLDVDRRSAVTGEYIFEAVGDILYTLQKQFNLSDAIIDQVFEGYEFFTYLVVEDELQEIWGLETQGHYYLIYKK